MKHFHRVDSTFDYLFIGSSQCKCNISPHHLEEELEKSGGEISAFNGGIQGATVATWRFVYDRIGPLLDVDTLVIVVSPGGMMGPADTRITQDYGFDFLAGNMWWPEKFILQLHLHRYRRQYRSLRYQFYVLKDRSIQGDLKRRLGPYFKGWSPTSGGFAAALPTERQTEEEASDSRISAESVQALTETIRLAQNLCRRVVLLVPPHPPRFDLRFTRSDLLWSDFFRELRRVSDETGVRIIDHHRLAEYGDEGFADTTHLNNKEAPHYSRRVLAAALQEVVD